MCLILLMLTSAVLAHNPSKTYMTMKAQNGQLQVQLELPWSITEAVKKEFPEIGDNTSKEEFMEFVFEYVVRNFKISKNGIEYQIIKSEFLPGDHSHSTTLELSFPLKTIKGTQIINTLMFNLNEKQKNYHTIILQDDTEFSFISTKKYPQFFVTENAINKGKNNSLLLIFSLMFVLISVSLFWKSKSMTVIKNSFRKVLKERQLKIFGNLGTMDKM